MKIQTLLLLLFFTYQVSGCQNSKKGESRALNKNSRTNIKEDINFLGFLNELCWEGHEGVLKNCDELVTNKGNMFFILVPKIGAKNWYLKQMNNYKSTDKWQNEDKIIGDVNKVKKSTIIENFNIWVFYIDIKYLNRSNNMDSEYSTKIPRKIAVYKLNDKFKQWNIVNTLDIENKNNESKENSWREDFIEKIIQSSNNITGEVNKNSLKISLKWQGTYQREFSDKFADGTSISWIYSFVVDENKIIFKSDTYPGETEYKAIEKNAQLLLFDFDEENTSFLIKEEKGKYFIKGSSFENNNEWLLFKKNI